MLKINSKISVNISLVLTAVMFAGALALAFFVPTLIEYMLGLPDLNGALLDLSTGEFCVEEFATEAKLAEGLERANPAEMLEATDDNRWTF